MEVKKNRFVDDSFQSIMSIMDKINLDFVQKLQPSNLLGPEGTGVRAPAKNIQFSYLL